MNEMLQRLTAIIERQHRNAGSIHDCDGEKNARELVAALSKPTREMKEDGAPFTRHGAGPAARIHAEDTWGAMIAAILK